MFCYHEQVSPAVDISDQLADVPTPAGLLVRLRAAHVVEEVAGVEILQIALAWAHAHPALDDDHAHAWRPVAASARASLEDDGGPDPLRCDDEDLEWFAIPPITWDAPAAFAAAHHQSTTSGKALIRDALVLAHRLPLTWARLLAGGIPAYRARRVAQSILGAPPDVATYVDQRVHRVLDRIGTTGLGHLLDQAMLELYPEQREADQIEALDRRHATLDRSSINHTGVADMALRADYADLDDFDQALSHVAKALADPGLDPTVWGEGHHESLDVRRSRAVGILADPARALALLRPDRDTDTAAVAVPTREIRAYLHLRPEHLAGIEPVVGQVLLPGSGLVAMLEQLVRSWCGRTDRFLRITPVVDLTEDPAAHATAAHDPSAALRERVLLRHPTCVFPWCTRASTDLDLDHIEPYGVEDPDAAPPGCGDLPQTNETNLAPLCRHHHNLKTHAGWTYQAADPLGAHPTFTWTDPHGQRYLRTPDGTLDLTDDSVRPLLG